MLNIINVDRVKDPELNNITPILERTSLRSERSGLCEDENPYVFLLILQY